MADTTFDRINTVLSETLGNAKESLRPDHKLVEDLLLDSLDMVEMAMALEVEFQVEIPDTDWENAADMTLAQVADLIDRRLSCARAGDIGDGYYDLTPTAEGA
ncbi:MAG: acyl carrier protein [Niveispirillum sp.]|uniref:acyl carrier protein n=1 Tax=Niveispirillum sp. TaxID=1917217 RepID=UPI003BA410DF